MIVSENVIRKFAAKLKENIRELVSQLLKKIFILPCSLMKSAGILKKTRSQYFSKLVFKGGTLLNKSPFKLSSHK